ncbi:hypothetical protein Q8G45_28240, partial [Klebsiella pneumoniae]
STGCDFSPTLGVKVNDVHALQLLKDVASNTPTALAEMWWGTTISLAATIYPPKSTNTNTSPQIDFPCH